MVAYRTDKPLSRVKGGSNVMSCEDFVKDYTFKTSKGEGHQGTMRVQIDIRCIEETDCEPTPSIISAKRPLIPL